MHVVQCKQRTQRRMYLPSERMAVNGEGLGELEGFFKKLSFKPGKAFKAFIKITPKSFRPKNIAGALGSAVMFSATGGLSTLMSKKTGAHSPLARTVGYVTMAAAAVAGAVVAAPMIGAGAGAWGAGALKAVSGAGTLFKGVGGMFGRKGGEQQQQGGMTQEEYNMQQQAAYDAKVSNPATYGAGIPVEAQLNPVTYPTMTNIPSGYGGSGYSSSTDMRVSSPYSPLADDSNVQLDPTGQLVPIGQQVDPATRRLVPVQAGMIPDLSMTTWLAIGGATLVGWYFMSGSKSNN